MNIKILGMGCCNCGKLYEATQESVKELGIEATIEKIEDMAKIMEYGVMRTPALVIDEQVVVQGRIPKKDEIIFKGKKIQPQNKKVYILLNKPIGYVTTVSDQFNRDTVLDLVKVNTRIVPVGRLDMYTSGALILTNDGDFVNKVTHPSKKIEKTYTVTVIGIVTKEEVLKLEQGVLIDDNYVTKPAKVKILKIDIENNKSRLEIKIHEGKNRQVRKMCEAINKKVIALHRTKIGNIGVKDLKIGTWRYLTQNEVKNILNQ